jgi:hypothetical protein
MKNGSGIVAAMPMGMITPLSGQRPNPLQCPNREKIHYGPVDQNRCNHSWRVGTKNQSRRNVRDKHVHKHRNDVAEQQVRPDTLLALATAQVRQPKGAMVNTKTANRNSPAENCTGIRLPFRSTHPGSQIASSELCKATAIGNSHCRPRNDLAAQSI